MTFYQLRSILLVTVTLGPFAYVRSYPIYSMLAAAELSVVTRLDIINLLGVDSGWPLSGAQPISTAWWAVCAVWHPDCAGVTPLPGWDLA